MFTQLLTLAAFVTSATFIVWFGVWLLSDPRVRRARDWCFRAFPTSVLVNMMFGCFFVFFGSVPLHYGSGSYDRGFWPGFACVGCWLVLIGFGRVTRDWRWPFCRSSLPVVLVTCVMVL